MQLSAHLKYAPLLALLLTMAACQSPFLVFSGRTLTGPVVEADSFSFAEQFKLLQLEVRPADAYSVLLRVSMIDDRLYIDAAQNRRWHDYLRVNNSVRIKLGGQVYPATAVLVEDPNIARQFLRDRTIYRLDPRSL